MFSSTSAARLRRIAALGYLLQSALGDEQGEEFAFGDVDGGKGVHGMRVAIGEDLGVELDGEFEAVAHEGKPMLKD